jgi:iduronate 2-sulfatase
MLSFMFIPSPLRILGLTIALALSAGRIGAAPVTAKPNVLFIVADDLRDTVGCYGNPLAKTPNIDRLAARGVRFEHIYAQYPVCNPSRTSFMTGLRCEQTGVVGNLTQFRTRLPNIVTFPQLLRQNGWRAISYGKIFHAGEGGAEARAAWMDLGKSWDEAEMFRATPAGKVIEGRNLTGGALKWCEWGMTAGTDDDQPDGQTAAHGVAAIERLTAENKPWLVATGFHRPHDPFLAPKKYFDLYPPGSLPIYHDPANASPLRPLSLPPGGLLEAFKAFTDQERGEFERAYYAGVSFTDAQIGRLLDTLDRLKLWDNTVVIFISDHGYHHNERSWWNKNTLFERSCRVPCIIAAPGVRGGQTARALGELVDLYPTIADFCGVKAPHDLAGRSLRPVLEKPAETVAARTAACTLVVRGANYGQAIRTEQWRYVQWSDGTAELYDAVKDPQETNDLSTRPESAATIRDLKSRLRQIVPAFEVPTERSGSPKKKQKSV